MNKISPPTEFQMLGGDVDASPRPQLLQLAVLSLAIVLSLVILWFSTQKCHIWLGPAALAIIAAAGLIQYFRGGRTADNRQVLSVPDWSITHAATQSSNAAIAISDRAGRLVCANDHFTMAFPGLKAPPDLGVDDASRVDLSQPAVLLGATEVPALMHEGKRAAVTASRSHARARPTSIFCGGWHHWSGSPLKAARLS